MLQWFRNKLGAANSETRHGVPEVRRVKGHTAASGYVYQYYFAGYRECPPSSSEDGLSDREYDFILHPGQHQERCISLILSGDLRRKLSAEIGREISNRECYAIAKLSLFTLLDEAPSPSTVQLRHAITSESALEAWSLLDL